MLQDSMRTVVFGVLWTAYVLLSLSIIGGSMYVLYHFVAKYW